jgi:hypothetical protein
MRRRPRKGSMRSRLATASVLAHSSHAGGQEPPGSLGERPGSVVSQHAYGDRAKIVLEVIPVIPRLIRRPLLGGD